MLNNGNPILLVEDDTVDVMTVRRAMKDIGFNSPLQIMGSGEEALGYLRGDDKKPCLILLDLNMPRMNGLEFLKEIKRDSLLRSIPVIILTTSQEECDKRDSFDLGAAGYIVKPIEYEDFVGAVRTIQRYWSLSELPAQPPSGDSPAT